MEMQYFKDYSPALGRDMECKIYGHAGRPMLYVPCQDGRFFDFEDFHMADTLAPWIESGQIMVLSIDTLDKETWSDTNGNPYWRIRRYEQWLHYIVDEAVPKLRCLSQGAQRLGRPARRHRLWLQPGCHPRSQPVPAPTGHLLRLSGAQRHLHRPLWLRRLHGRAGVPELSRGLYAELPHRPPLYGAVPEPEGAWEQPDTTWYLKRIFEAKGIPVWVDLWGHDVKHDWDWWYKQVVYYMPYILGQQ